MTYQPAWDDLRARRRRCWIAALFVLPLVLLAAILPPAFCWLGLPLWPGWIVGGMACFVRLHFFPCPRCRHCRLPQWSEPLPQ